MSRLLFQVTTSSRSPLRASKKGSDPSAVSLLLGPGAGSLTPDRFGVCRGASVRVLIRTLKPQTTSSELTLDTRYHGIQSLRTSNYILPLKAPTPVPGSGVEIVTFKVWKNTLISHIQQDVNRHHFMPGGLYSTWIAAEYGNRITELDEADHDRLVIEGKRARTAVEEYQRSLVNLLAARNSQLSKFITHIACLSYHTEHDDLTNSSTSMDV